MGIEACYTSFILLLWSATQEIGFLKLVRIVSRYSIDMHVCIMGNIVLIIMDNRYRIRINGISRKKVFLFIEYVYFLVLNREMILK